MKTRIGMRYFIPIWLGQLFSTIGTSMAGFALSVWIYQQTDSPLAFAMGLLCETLPGIVLAPLAGIYVDRWDRRKVMLFADLGAALGTLVLAGLFAAGRLEVWHIYLFNAFTASLNTFQQPAYQAAITMLVAPSDYGRANGMVQIGEALGMIIAPALGGTLLLTLQISGVLLLDVITASLAIGMLLVMQIPNPVRSTENSETSGSMWAELTFGWRYILARPGLTGLMTIFAMVNLFLGFFSSLFLPLLLNLTTADIAGIVGSIGGIGMLIGSLVMSVWGGPKRRVQGLLGSLLILGFGYALAGGSSSLILLGIVMFIMCFVTPIANSSSQAIWQQKVAPDIQGRVFTTRRMISTMIMPLSYLFAGSLAEQAEPLMMPGGALAGSVGLILGTGPGRGIGLIFVLMGLCCMLVTAVGYLNPRIRRVEDELPDAQVTAAPEEPSLEMQTAEAF